MSLNQELSALFEKAATAIDVLGGNRFKAIAFGKIGRLLDGSALDLRKHAAQGTLKDIEGIGKSSADIIAQYVKEGRSTEIDQLLSEVPPGVLELLAVPGLGPKTVNKLWKDRNVNGPAELLAAIEKGDLEDMAGLGEKKIAQIKQGLSIRQAASERRGIGDALPIARAIADELAGMKGVLEVQIAGSLRRGRETIGDVDLIARVPDDVNDPSHLTEAFTRLETVKDVLGLGPTKASIRTADNLQIDLRIVPDRCFGAALLYFTGSKDHNIRLRGMANAKGCTLNEWGIYDEAAFRKAEKPPGYPPTMPSLAGRTEEDVYRWFELDWIPPELREGRGEVELAAAGNLPALLTADDLRGELHCHTFASDGTNSIEEMAAAAKKLGYSYLAITDHSKSQVIARGLDAPRLLKHAEEIRNVSAKLKGITLLPGIEVDILTDGRLDLPDEVLKELDWVVASPHVSLRQDEGKATARLLKAMDNPYVNVIGHPTGRYINRREGLPLDMPKVVEHAARTGTALEINASWPRLDLRDSHARLALEAGCMLTLDTDAHSTAGLGERALGVMVARRAGTQAKDLVNAQPLTTLRKFVSAKR